MKQTLVYKAALKLALVSAMGLLVACSDDAANSTTTTVTGSVVAAPVNGASVSCTDGINTLAGPVTSASDGSYSIDVPNSAFSGSFMCEASGGTFTDEATGATTTAGMLKVHIDGAAHAADSKIHLTPASTILHDMVKTHGMTRTAAMTAFQAAFGFDADDANVPADAVNPAAGASEAELLAGLRLAAFSQLTKDMGLNPAQQFDLLPALAEDLANGGFDGTGITGPVAIGTGMLPANIQNNFSQALVDFNTGAMNQTGLGNDKIGILPFARVALTATYKIEYVASMMDVMAGKSEFTLRISDKVSGQAATGLTVGLMPMMYMADRYHSSPNADCTESTTAGDYSCTMYYLMPSVMNGVSMGYWQLKVMPTMTESAYFYPNVMMAMGDTAMVRLKGQSTDMIYSMTGPANRTYNIFKDDLSGIDMDNNRTFGVYVSAMETMMSFPGVSVGKILNSGTAYELTVTTMTVEMSTDGTNWIAATDNSNGHWSATGLSDLVDGTTGMIHLRLTINGEQKTTDGMTPAGDGTNDYSSFSITPGATMGMMQGGM